MYGFELETMVSTCGNKSRDISTEAMFPRVHRARPTMYWLGWFKSLGRHQHAIQAINESNALL